MQSITAGPNRRRFLEQPTEHVKSTHPYTDPIKRTALPPTPTPQKVVAVGTIRSNSFKGTQLLLVSKYSKKIKYVDIASYYCPSKLPVTAKCEDVDHVFGKGFHLTMV